MDRFVALLQLLTSVSIGLLAGALLTEGCLLVQYWRSLSTDAFHELYRDLHPRLYRYFTPLTAAPLVLSLVTAGTSLAVSTRGKWLTVAAAVLMVMVVATHEVYFKKANTQFAGATLSGAELSAELSRWSAWNWLRIGLALLAFGSLITAHRLG